MKSANGKKQTEMRLRKPTCRMYPLRTAKLVLAVAMFLLGTSALSMAGTAAKPILLVGTKDALGLSSYLVGVDLAKGALAWKVNINPTFGVDNTQGQFPIMIDASGKSIIVAAGAGSGPYFVAQP